MAKKDNSNNEPFYEIGDILGIVKESGTTDWSKVVAYFNWLSEKKKGDKTTLDIRNYNFSSKQIGKGVSLSHEEADRLTSILLEVFTDEFVILFSPTLPFLLASAI